MSVDYPTKRAFDATVAAFGLIASAPLLGVLAVAVRLASPGPAWHRSARVGRNGTLFTLLKFRTMRIGAQVSGPAITASGDARITKLGALLRRSKLDELPQLINVIRGDMSVVGPRPEDSRYVDRYDDEQRHILSWRPGVTSPASVTYRDEERVLARAADLEAAYQQLSAEKLRIDLAYFPTSTLRSDLAVIARTVLAIVRR